MGQRRLALPELAGQANRLKSWWPLHGQMNVNTRKHWTKKMCRNEHSDDRSNDKMYPSLVIDQSGKSQSGNNVSIVKV